MCFEACRRCCRIVTAALIALMFYAPASHASDVRMPHYSIRATLAPQRGTIAVDVTVSLPPIRRGEVVEFLLGGSYSVTSVTANQPAPVTIAATEEPWPALQKISVAFAEASASPTVRFIYSGPPNPTGTLPINLITPSLAEMSFDSVWLPLRRDMNTDFTLAARLAGLPRNAVFVSQGEVRRVGTEVRVRRRTGETDFAFAAVPGLQKVSTPTIEFYSRTPNSARARLYRKHAFDSIQFLEQILGSLPIRPARLVMVPRERRSGYARQGYVVVAEAGSDDEEAIAGEISHEFAHGWFSNANATTEHRWLDESLASYVQLRYMETVFGAAAIRSMLEAMRVQARSIGPILGGLRSGSEFYVKGPVLLFDLEAQIGRERMDVLLRSVASSRVGTTPEFIAELARLTNEEQARNFHEALRR